MDLWIMDFIRIFQHIYKGCIGYIYKNANNSDIIKIDGNEKPVLVEQIFLLEILWPIMENFHKYAPILITLMYNTIDKFSNRSNTEK